MQSLKQFIAEFEECCSVIDDPRQPNKIDYPVVEILFLAIVAMAAGAMSWGMIEEFGKINIEILRQYYPFANGVPSDDTIRRMFEMLDPKHLNEFLMKYFVPKVEMEDEHLSIDGKSLKGSKRNRSKPLHFINVYATNSGITLFGQEVGEKTNEIKAIPEALDALDVSGTVVTIDAMGCQREIAKKITDKKAEYILGLKENQPTLYATVEKLFQSPQDKMLQIDIAVTEEKGHGRDEQRICRVIQDLSSIPQVHQWPAMKSIVEIKRTIASKGKITESTNYYISSCMDSANHMMKIIRAHWGIESMHWVLDVVFREDASSANKLNIPANLAIIRRFILNILHNMRSKRESKPSLIRKIGWSGEYLNKFIQKLIFCS